MKKASLMQRVAHTAFIVLIIVMLFLFFTTDLGLVDIHKTSIVVAVGVDVTEDGYDVTAQAAVPTPAVRRHIRRSRAAAPPLRKL